MDLQARGCELTVLTGKPNYPEGRLFPGYRLGGVQWENHDGIEILRVPLVPRSTGGALRLMLNYLSFIVNAGVMGTWGLRGRHYDLIFVYGTSPILQVLPGILLKALKRAPLVTWVQDFWPDSLETTGFVTNRRLLALVAMAVRWIYRRSDLVLVQSLALLDPVRAMAGNTAVAYHPNPGERPLFHASADADGGASEKTSAQHPPVWRSSPGFNIVFAGNLGTVQALDTVLEAAQMVGAEAGIRWVIVGSGTRSQWLQEQVRSRGLSQVELTGRFPPEQMPGIFAQADALLVSLVRAPAMSLTVPSKVQAYLAAGRPVLASLDGEGARVVHESGAGLVSPAQDAKALASTALRLARMSSQERQAMGEAGRSYYEQHFAPEMLADALLQHFKAAGAAFAPASKAQHE